MSFPERSFPPWRCAAWRSSALDARMKIAIIGGGPAGLRAAEVAAQGGATVTLYDAKASVGRKFLVAGRGGLNLTHTEPSDRFAARYSAPAERWKSLLADFDAEALRAWAAELGVETFAASTGRVYPRELKAAPLLRRWVQRLRAARRAFRHAPSLGRPADGRSLAARFPSGGRDGRAGSGRRNARARRWLVARDRLRRHVVQRAGNAGRRCGPVATRQLRLGSPMATRRSRGRGRAAAEKYRGPRRGPCSQGRASDHALRPGRRSALPTRSGLARARVTRTCHRFQTRQHVRTTGREDGPDHPEFPRRSAHALEALAPPPSPSSNTARPPRPCRAPPHWPNSPNIARCG